MMEQREPIALPISGHMKTHYPLISAVFEDRPFVVLYDLPQKKIYFELSHYVYSESEDINEARRQLDKESFDILSALFPKGKEIVWRWPLQIIERTHLLGKQPAKSDDENAFFCHVSNTFLKKGEKEHCIGMYFRAMIDPVSGKALMHRSRHNISNLQIWESGYIDLYENKIELAA